MAILVKLVALLTLFSVVNYASAIVGNEGLAIIKRDAPNDILDHQSDTYTCFLTPLGSGKDDTDNVGLVAIDLLHLITLGGRL
jgi:hypothetical protein